MDRIRVEIAYAEAERQWLIPTSVPAGSTVAQAIEHSGIRSQIATLQIDDEHVGVFGQRCRLDRVLADGERVEIYRPLLIDPREKRRQDAARKR